MQYLSVVVGDIAEIARNAARREPVAVVTAANKHLVGGGGVDKAIHAAAGPELLAACQRFPEYGGAGRCPPGTAVVTEGFGLPVRAIIHAVGPCVPANRAANELDGLTLRSTYANVARLANRLAVSTLVVPAISTGVYGFPVDLGALIALEELAVFTGSVIVAVYDDRAAEAYTKAMLTLRAV